MDPEKRVERMKEDLNLSDDQATRIREIFANQTGKQDCRNVENDDDRMQCRLDNRKAVHSQIDLVLTEDQKKKFQEIRKERRENYREMRKKDRGKNGEQCRGGNFEAPDEL